jgi:hypothetical protein
MSQEEMILRVSASNPQEMSIETHGLRGECTADTVAMVVNGGGYDPKVQDEFPSEVYRDVVSE